MKRIIAVLLVLTICFSLSGCGLMIKECEYCHDDIGEYRDDAGSYDYLCEDCYYDHILESDDLFDDYDLDLDNYLDDDYFDDDDDYDYYYSNNYCDDCGDRIPSNRNYCDDCLQEFIDSLDDY